MKSIRNARHPFCERKTWHNIFWNDTRDARPQLGLWTSCGPLLSRNYFRTSCGRARRQQLWSCGRLFLASSTTVDRSTATRPPALLISYGGRSNIYPDFVPYWLPPHFYQITVGCIIGCTIGCTEHNWLQNLKPRYVIIAMLSLILVRKNFSQKCMCHSFCWRRRK